VRHLADGMHENQVSKAVLLLVIEALTALSADFTYFPSYEILLDDLRDYRFYADDMLHPSAQAVNYIWEKFSETYFSQETKNLAKQFEDIHKALNHKPFNPDSTEYKKFLNKIDEKKMQLSQLKVVSLR
jgi:hypothetical protein